MTRRIALIGGIERSHRALARAVAELGHVLEVHDGEVGGRGVHVIESLVGRSDIVIIAIGINSHGGALIAKDFARRRGRPSFFIRKPSVSSLLRVLRGLEARV
jgi:Uncharacterized protein conserved in bacteria (DUF2325)